MARANITKLDPDRISERLIESVNMVKELLQGNRQLRDTIDRLTSTGEKNESDLYQLQVENRDLRDKIEVLESIIKAHPTDYENYDWRSIINEENPNYIVSTNNKAVDTVASEMLELKKNNRMLENRVKHLELQNMHLSHNYDYHGNIEPTRTLVDWSKNSSQRDMRVLNSFEAEPGARVSKVDDEPRPASSYY